MELNQFEAELLDIVLEAFGERDRMTRDQVLDLFGLDEETAAAMVSILAAEGLVTEIGRTEEYALPLVLNKEAKAMAFLKDGGYARRYREAVNKSATAGEIKNLEKINLDLRNENLDLQITIRQQQEKLRLQEMRLKRWVWLRYVLVLAGMLLFRAGWWLFDIFKHHPHHH